MSKKPSDTPKGKTTKAFRARKANTSIDVGDRDFATLAVLSKKLGLGGDPQKAFERGLALLKEEVLAREAGGMLAVVSTEDYSLLSAVLPVEESRATKNPGPCH